MNLPPLIASLSGGKDSTAMALHFRELDIPFRAVFLDTGWEADETYEYLDYLEGVLRQPIERVRGPWTFEYLCIHKGSFPMLKRRWCTEYLKIKPFLAWVATEYPDVEIVSATGVRAAESKARAAMVCVEPMRESLGQVIEWRPLLPWSEQDVMDCHKRNGVYPNPLYMRGVRRVGCFPCIYARKTDLATLSESRILRIEALERSVREVHRIRVRSGQRSDSPGAADGPKMFSIRKDGKHHSSPNREIVAWAKTSHGGKQYTLAGTEEPGCMRWGLCE